MGNNAAFSNFEEVVCACYKHGVLTKPLLNDIVEAFKGQDADSGGFNGTLINGKDLYDIVIEVGGLIIPPKPDLPKDWRKWTQEQDEANEAWQEARSEAFNKIADLD